MKKKLFVIIPIILILILIVVAFYMGLFDSLLTPSITINTKTTGEDVYTSATSKINIKSLIGIKNTKYCFTTEKKCNPDKKLEDNKKEYTIEYKDGDKKQKLCVSSTTIFKTKKVVCDKYYFVNSTLLEDTMELSNYKIKTEEVKDTQELKVLVIEINPTLQTVYGNPKVSEYFGHNPDATLNGMVKDLEQSSHGYLKVKIQREYLNEFPKYTSTVPLVNGGTSNSFDEQTYLHYASHTGSNRGNWFKLLENKIFNVPKEYSYDYEYIMDKFNLIEKRNNNEFDQVWLLTIDPAQTFETKMIGNNAYYVNGDPTIKSCQNFIIANISISRPDSNFHAVGHGVEGIMSDLFKMKKNTYQKNAFSVNSKDDFNYLDLWSKFTIGSYSNNTQYTGVGNIHFPFNAGSDYDYSNTNQVQSNWREWENYPNINGEFQPSNNSAWLNHPINQMLTDSDNKDPDRLYVRFWFYLFPHHTGYTKEGYSNNWWNYFYSLDKVNNIECSEKLTINVGEKLDNYEVTNIYASGKKESKEINVYENNLEITNKEMLRVKENGEIYPVKVGKTQITYHRDGVICTTNIEIQ